MSAGAQEQAAQKEGQEQEEEGKEEWKQVLDTTSIPPFRHQTTISNALKRGKKNKNNLSMLHNHFHFLNHSHF